MNQFLLAAKQLIGMHGKTFSYTKVTQGTYDPSTGSVTNSESTTSLTAYKKHIKATQYNYPNLIGKDAASFLIASDSFVDAPSVNDKITEGTSVYTVDSIQEHLAFNEIVMYTILAYKG